MTGNAAAFAPYDALATALFVQLGPTGTDGSHDMSHILRVWRNAVVIARSEPDADTEVRPVAPVPS